MDLRSDAGAEIDAFSLSAAVAAMTRGSQPGLGAALVEMAGEQVARGVDAVVFAAAVTACERGALWAEALRLVSTLRSQELQPGVQCLASASGALMVGRADLEQAASFLTGLAQQRAFEELMIFKRSSNSAIDGGASHDAIVAEALPRSLGLDDSHMRAEPLRRILRAYVVAPVEHRLRNLMQCLPTSPRHKGSRMPAEVLETDNLLKTQYGLGELTSKEVLRELLHKESNCDDDNGGIRRRRLRSVLSLLRQRHLLLPVEPISRILVVSIDCSLQLGTPSFRGASCTELPLFSEAVVGYGGKSLFG
eukprot:TRINITY_DN113708_c0_g1_i1.p1 TRINITY_DN113708_c0_g1~~TRINITY_DN113708_c0_g1_i1.p1  ORF type:complete len:307 (+),score=62.00 TRINITY_DN113708_c0_g1_i1:205-1125(+)